MNLRRREREDPRNKIDMGFPTVTFWSSKQRGRSDPLEGRRVWSGLLEETVEDKYIKRHSVKCGSTPGPLTR